ncbi:class I adenylate-forming enzyme family protein [Pontibaca methylaminivorans]|uniref:class I adenylate-forming enzyme family protein n=1 Tax=Pontibaca methylaminivorans TaxID=515897 RepID=UPI002FDAE217
MLSIFDEGPPPPCPAPFNLAAHVLGRAGARPDKPALLLLDGNAPQESQEWSFRDLERAVRATGSGLLAEGLAPGDIVLMRLGNSVDFPIAYLGAIAAGLVPVPASAQLTGPEIAALIATLAPRAVLRDPAVASAPHAHEIPLGRLQTMRGGAPCTYAMGDPERMAYVVYTSGTSGQPQAVAHAHRAIWARQMMFEDWYGLRADDRLLHAGAFNWTFTLGTGLMDPWTIGATALIPSPRTEIAALPALLRKSRATIFAAAPGVYRKILQSGGKIDLPDLRHGICAGEKLSPALQAAWHEATGTPLYEAFGMSECSTFISAGPGCPARQGMLGRPQKGRRVAITDGTGNPLPLGEAGTIAVARRDPGLMLGYLGADEATRSRFRGEWFLTGDQGTMAADGQISYLGRGDDMMNAGGVRVSPLEVEEVLNTHPGIRQAAVTDVEIKPDTRIIVAFYTGPVPVPAASLEAHCAQNLARYKQPRAFVHLDALPLGANGKLRRSALRAHFKAEQA